MRHLPECPLDVIVQVGEQHAADFHFHHSGLDLGEIQNFVDQFQEIRTGRIDGPCKFTLLFVEVLFGFREQLGQNKHAVQRGSKLVRHVCKELGLVLRCQGQLFCFFLQRAAGLFDFLVLAFDFEVLLCQQVGFFFQFFVRLLQLVLLLPQTFFGFLEGFGLFLQSAIGFGQFRLAGLQFVG